MSRDRLHQSLASVAENGKVLDRKLLSILELVAVAIGDNSVVSGSDIALIVISVFSVRVAMLHRASDEPAFLASGGFWGFRGLSHILAGSWDICSGIHFLNPIINRTKVQVTYLIRDRLHQSLASVAENGKVLDTKLLSILELVAVTIGDNSIVPGSDIVLLVAYVFVMCVAESALHSNAPPLLTGLVSLFG